MTPDARLRDLLLHAWDHSAFYRETYARHGLGRADLPHVTLDELPVVSKADLMVRFDEAVTDPRLRKADLETWTQTDPNPLNRYLDEYIVVRSSAGSAIRSFVPYTRPTWRAMTATVAPFLLPLAQGMDRPMRSAFYYFRGAHTASATSMSLASQSAHEALYLSVLDPMEEIWAQLNAFQPERLYTYASALSWLLDWTRAGTLHIRPSSVIVSSDRLAPAARDQVAEAWGSELFDLYAACESLYMAVKRPHDDEFQAFTDLNVLEVVDADNRMVQPGTRGRVLLTSLLHTTLPLIRFDLHDWAVLGKAVRGTVGLGAQTLTSLDGKLFDRLPVRLVDGTVGALENYELAQVELPGVDKLQFVKHSPDEVELFYQARQDLDAELRHAFQHLLAQNAAVVATVRVRRVPHIMNDSVSGKCWTVAAPGRATCYAPSLAAETRLVRMPDGGTATGANLTFTPADLAGSVDQRFRRIATHAPNRCAVTDGQRRLTYGEVDALSRQVAGALRHRGFDPARPVAVWCAHQPELLPLILGVLAAGGFYLPLDPGHPPARLQAMLNASRPQFLVTTRSQRASAQALAADRVHVLCMEDLEAPAATFGSTVSSASPACLLFTSGSTGAAKGVMLSHSTILHRAARYSEDFRISPQDRVSLLQSYAVSAGLRDIYGAVLSGATLAVYDVRARGLALLANWLNEQRITVFYAVPTLFRLFLETLTDERFPSVRVVRLGGEPMQPADVSGFGRHFAPSCRLANGYAATEVGTVCVHLMDHDSRLVGDRIPAGVPAPGVHVTLRNEAGDPANGALGEIVVDGPALASGYWDRAAGGVVPFARPYATGDLGYQLDDGRIFLTGRRDAMVKIHGHRVHLDAIERAVDGVAGVAEAAAVARRNGVGEPAIAVYYAPQVDVEVSLAALRWAAAAVTPAAASIAFRALPSLPRLPGGKIDRGALPEEPLPEVGLPSPAPVYGTETEARLARLWQDVLSVAHVAPTADFLDLGGDSVTVFRLLARIHAEFGVRLSVREFFSHRVLSAMAQAIASRIPQ